MKLYIKWKTDGKGKTHSSRREKKTCVWEMMMLGNSLFLGIVLNTETNMNFPFKNLPR